MSAARHPSQSGAGSDGAASSGVSQAAHTGSGG